MTVIYQDLGLKNIISSLDKLENDKLEVGIFDGKNATIGLFQEFGTKRGIPESPFLRSSLRGSQLKKLKRQIVKELRFFYKSKGSYIFLDNLGKFQVDNITKAIVGKSWQGYKQNKKSTEKRKGFNHRLIDKAILINSIDYRVIK